MQQQLIAHAINFIIIILAALTHTGIAAHRRRRRRTTFAPSHQAAPAQHDNRAPILCALRIAQHLLNCAIAIYILLIYYCIINYIIILLSFNINYIIIIYYFIINIARAHCIHHWHIIRAHRIISPPPSSSNKSPHAAICTLRTTPHNSNTFAPRNICSTNTIHRTYITIRQQRPFAQSHAASIAHQATTAQRVCQHCSNIAFTTAFAAVAALFCCCIIIAANHTHLLINSICRY